MDRKIIGVLGGGQLGRMMAIAAHNLGTVKVLISHPTANETVRTQYCGTAAHATNSTTPFPAISPRTHGKRLAETATEDCCILTWTTPCTGV